MKVFALLLLGLLMMTGCKEKKADVVAAPKVTAETREKVEEFFLYLGKVEAALVTGSQKENLAMITGVVPELEMAERAVLRDIPKEDHKQWDRVVWQVRQFCLAALTYVRLLAMGDEVLLRAEINRMPLRISQKLRYHDGDCYASENLEVVSDEVAEVRKDVLAEWDALMK